MNGRVPHRWGPVPPRGSRLRSWETAGLMVRSRTAAEWSLRERQRRHPVRSAERRSAAGARGRRQRELPPDRPWPARGPRPGRRDGGQRGRGARSPGRRAVRPPAGRRHDAAARRAGDGARDPPARGGGRGAAHPDRRHHGQRPARGPAPDARGRDRRPRGQAAARGRARTGARSMAAVARHPARDRDPAPARPHAARQLASSVAATNGVRRRRGGVRAAGDARRRVVRRADGPAVPVRRRGTRVAGRGGRGGRRRRAAPGRARRPRVDRVDGRGDGARAARPRARRRDARPRSGARDGRPARSTRWAWRTTSRPPATGSTTCWARCTRERADRTAAGASPRPSPCAGRRPGAGTTSRGCRRPR